MLLLYKPQDPSCSKIYGILGGQSSFCGEEKKLGKKSRQDFEIHVLTFETTSLLFRKLGGLSQDGCQIRFHQEDYALLHQMGNEKVSLLF